jgi:hypothetical protein
MANLRASHAAGAFPVRGPDSAAALRVHQARTSTTESELFELVVWALEMPSTLLWVEIGE